MFQIGDEVLYMGGQWIITAIEGEIYTLVSDGPAGKQERNVSEGYLTPLAIDDDDDTWDSRRDSLLPRP